MPDIIRERYRILKVLGQGGFGITYAAEDLQTSQQVALKVISLHQVQEFKILELFEREASILRQLNHPAIPRYLDSFEIDQPRNRLFYIIQQLAEGHSLSAWIEQGWQPTEAEVCQIARQMLDILIYLQQLTPPIIHRDIKPQNIIRRQDGQIFLVDFGAVRDTFHNTLAGGSTVIGTYGYMAPEQFRGQAMLATDLYGLGATLLFLLTRQDPADLPQRKLKIDFRAAIKVHRHLADWLDVLLEPIASDRFESAAEALAVLNGEKQYIRQVRSKAQRPRQSSIRLESNAQQLLVSIPPTWLSNRQSQLWFLIPAAWNACLLLLLSWLWVSLWISGSFLELEGFLFLLFFGCCGLVMLGWFLINAGSAIQLTIVPPHFYLKRTLFGWPLYHLQVRIQDLAPIQLRESMFHWNNRQKLMVCEVRSRLQRHRFGVFLSEPEKAWLVDEIQVFLEKQKAGRTLQ